MTEDVALAAEVRNRVGKGGARACRRDGFVPGIVYGGGEAPMAIAVPVPALQRQFKQPGFLNHVIDLRVDGGTQRVLPRDIQLDPLSSKPIHIDFMRVSATTEVSVAVAISFINDDLCPGLKRGGVLNIVEHSVEVVCRPDHIPERLEADLAGRELGDVLHIEEVPLPAGVRLAPGWSGSTIASIAAPTVEAAPSGGGEAGAADATGSSA